MVNKIISRFTKDDKIKLYKALQDNQIIYATRNKRTAPNSIIDKYKYYTVAINPLDLSYFDFKVLNLKDLITIDGVKMIQEYYKKHGFRKAYKAYKQSFCEVYRQYSLSSILKMEV